MKEKLKILLVEDNPADVKLLQIALRKEFKPEITTVQTESEFRKKLSTFDGDIIISDFSLPKFTGLRALNIKEKIAKHFPFILVTGSINEETAVEVMKAGADDYVIKEHLSRLNSAIKSALLKRKAFKEREEAEEHFRNIFENSLVGLYRTTPSGKILLGNPALLQMLGFKSLGELSKRNLEKEGFAPGYSRAKFKKQMKETGEVVGFESAWKTKSGEIIFVTESAKAIKDEKNRILYYEGVVENITEKKRAEESLKESRRKFNTMIDNLSGIVYRCVNDHDWTMEYISEAVLDLTGFLSTDFTSKKVNYNQIIHPDDRDYVWSEIQKAVKKKKSFLIEYRILTDKNILKWVWEKGRGVFEKNQLLALEGFITDITDRKLSEEKLNASEKKFRALIEKSYEAFAMIDISGKLLYVSPTIEKIYGFKVEELLGKNGFDYIHPDDIPMVMERFVQLVDSPGDFTSLVCRFLHKNGDWLYSEVFSTNLLHDPEVGAIVVNYHDITEKRKADEAIKKASEKYRSIVEGTRAILFSTNKKGIFTYVNEAACLVFGLPEKEIVGKFYLKFVHKEAREQIHKLFTKQLVSPTPNISVDVRITTKTVTDGWLNLLINPVYENSSIVGLTAVALDITEKMFASTALQQKYDHLELLNALNASLQGILDLKAMIQNCYSIIPKFVKVDRTSILMYDEKHDGLIGDKFIGEDIAINPEEVQSLDIGVSGKCFREMQVIAIDDCSKNKIIPKQYVASLNLKSTVAIPLKAEGRSIGVLRLDHTSKKHSFSMEDLEFYNLLGNQLGTILRNAQLFTEQKKISFALKESEKSFRNVVETANEGIIVTDADDTITFANKKFSQMLGYNVEELLNTKYTVLLPEEDKKIFIKYNTDRRLGLPGAYEQKLIKKDGGFIYAIVAASPIIDDENKFQGSFGMFTDITDRKNAAEKLIESEQSYIGLFNSVAEAIYIQGMDGKFIDVNQGAVNMYGYSHEEFIGRSQEFLSAPLLNDKINIPEMLKTVFASGTPAQFEFWGRRKNGEIFPKEVICNKGRYFGKEVLIVTARDITERKKMEESLKESEIRFRTLVEQSPFSTQIFDPAGNTKIVNTAFCKLWNVSASDLQTILTHYNILKDEQLETVGLMTFIKKGFAEEFTQIPAIYYDPQKTSMVSGTKLVPKWVKGYIWPVLDDEGKVSQVVLMHEDITERKHSEEEVHKLSHAIQQSPVAVIITNLEGDIEYANPKASELSGYSLHELLGKNPRILSSGTKPINEYEELWDTIILGKEWRGEFQNKKKSGELYWVSSLISPIFSETGEIIRYLAVEEDITEMKKMIEELREAKEKAEEMNRVKSSFFANMSHELRTPLIGILGYSEIMQEDSNLNEDYIHMAKNIYRGGRRLYETVNMILNISKIESDKHEARFEKIDIVTIVRESVSLFLAAAQKKNLKLELLVNEEKIICYADTKLVSDVFNNLVNNAIKFTEVGSVTVAIELDSKHVVIKVIDTGIGIPKDKHGIIWEEFRQSSEGMGRSFEGTGLGLTISKKYVELMGGTITLESEEGEGSTFKVEFPIVD